VLDRETLLKELAEAQARKEQHLAMANQHEGAIRLLEKLVAMMQETPKES
jgi:adenosylmethionine-8-amino-7-oxononanoate aminotransferase